MPCGNFLLCHICKFGPLLTIIINDGDQYFENEINFMSKKSSLCYVSNFNIWITIIDVNMTSWVQL